MEPDAPARHLFERDPTVSTFGIELVTADADGAAVRMTVRPDMCNGYGMIHGGLTFLLADSAMALERLGALSATAAARVSAAPASNGKTATW